MSQYRGVVKWSNAARGYGSSGRDDSQAKAFARSGGANKDGVASRKDGDAMGLKGIQSAQNPQADEIAPRNAEEPDETV